MTATPSFARHGPLEPTSPVVLSVPHAGRDYPLPLRAALRVPLAAIRGLEDRHADSLGLQARRHETLFVAGRARAWIDLNRAEYERDPKLDDGAHSIGRPQSTGVRINAASASILSSSVAASYSGSIQARCASSTR